MYTFYLCGLFTNSKALAWCALKPCLPLHAQTECAVSGRSDDSPKVPKRLGSLLGLPRQYIQTHVYICIYICIYYNIYIFSHDVI